MKILVLLKKVPDTGLTLQVKPDGSDIVRDNITYVINPYDEYAIEEALKIKEKLGDVETVAISVGDEGAKEQIRTALAMGIDRGILVKVDGFWDLDGYTTAMMLKDVIEKEGFDLILTGKMAVDDYNSQVPSYIAEIFNIPQASYIVKLELEGNTAKVERELETGMEVWELPLPAILTCEKGLNEPRYPSLRGIMQAKKKPIDVVEPSVSPAGTFKKVKLSPPPEKAPGKIIDKEFPENVKELVRLLREEAKVL